MKVVVDTNIVFSAILNSAGNIGKILIHGQKYFKFYSCQFLREEIFTHKNKLLKRTKLPENELLELIDLTTRNIQFINESLLPEKAFVYAYNLVKDIDEKDVVFVALTKHLKGALLWTGDKKLILGLQNKLFKQVIATPDLNNILSQKEGKR